MKLPLFDLRPGLAGSALVVGEIVAPEADSPVAHPDEQECNGDTAAEAQQDCKSR